ncbi:MAG TPA: hypothetical protein VL100_14030 [Croceibacterium sp.]|nr:hypothetical protein [Croceibacterium sp.]
MPIWLELLALMLAAYAAGLAFGWMVWGRTEPWPDERESGE